MAPIRGGWVPGLWHPVVANALPVAERRGVLTPAESDLFLSRLGRLPIDTDVDSSHDRQPRDLALARAHDLSSCDATDLDLAQRLDATLASLDRKFNQAASSVGVGHFP